MWVYSHDGPIGRFAGKEEEEEDAQDLLEPATGFYKEAALRAADGGVVVDLCVASTQYVDLASLQALAALSGGAVFLYRSLEQSTMPQVRNLIVQIMFDNGSLEVRNLIVSITLDDGSLEVRNLIV